MLLLPKNGRVWRKNQCILAQGRTWISHSPTLSFILDGETEAQRALGDWAQGASPPHSESLWHPCSAPSSSSESSSHQTISSPHSCFSTNSLPRVRVSSSLPHFQLVNRPYQSRKASLLEEFPPGLQTPTTYSKREGDKSKVAANLFPAQPFKGKLWAIQDGHKGHENPRY